MRMIDRQPGFCVASEWGHTRTLTLNKRTVYSLDEAQLLPKDVRWLVAT